MKKEEIKPEDKAVHCENWDSKTTYCPKMNQYIHNGFASLQFCEYCKYFEEKE